MATTFPFSRNAGSLNGMAEVTIVPSPPAGVQRVVRSIYISIPNPDPLSLEVSYSYGDSQSVLWQGVLQPLDTLMFGDGDAIVLCNDTDSIVAVLGSSPVAQPTFVANWGDRTSD